MPPIEDLAIDSPRRQTDRAEPAASGLRLIGRQAAAGGAAKQRNMRFGLVAALYAGYLFMVLADAFCSYLTDTAADAKPAWTFFYYFTNQSNLAWLVWLVLFAVATLGRGRFGRLVHSRALITGLTMYLAVVFIIVLGILEPFYTGAMEPVPSGGGLFTHVASPILALAIFLLYPFQGRVSAKTVVGCLVYLWAYVGLVNLVGSTVTWPSGKAAYAYDFLNPQGYGNLVIYIAVLAGLSLATFGLGMGLRSLKTRFDRGYLADH